MYCTVLTLLAFSAQSQTRVSATVHSVSNNSHIEDKGNAADGLLNTRARIKAYTGVAIFGGAYQGYIEMQFAETLPAHTTSYVKLGADDNILKPLVGGTLSNLLNNLANVVLTGSQQFTIEAKKDNDAPVVTGHSEVANNFATDKLRIAMDADGNYFAVITPDAPYNRIRITNRVGAALALGVTKRLDVYEAFYVTGSADCGIGALTSFSGTGISVTLLGLGTAGVSNPQFAINSILTDHSELGLGLLGVAASTEQTVYFQGQATAADKYFIKLGMAPGLLSLGIADQIKVTAYKGSVEGPSLTLNSLLTADLLGLLQSGNVVSVPFNAGEADRITVKLTGLLNVNLAQVVNLYGIVKSNLNVTVNGGTICHVGDAVTLSAQATGCSGPYTYSWSQTGTTQNINANTAAPGTIAYTVTVTDRYGISAIAHTQVEVERPPVAGTVTGGQGICPGTTPAALELTGHFGNIVRWEKAADENFTNPQTIQHTAAIVPAATIGAISETTYFRAVVKNGSYNEVYATPAVIIAKKTTWNGTEWSNGLPDLSTTIYITGNYSLAQDLNGCTMEVSSNAVVSIPSGFNVTLNGELKVLSGSFTLQNNANLVQLTDVQNTGNITVKRVTSPLYLLDYTMWSSPVTGTQTLKSFSPETVNNRFYVWSTAVNGFQANTSGLINPLTDTFARATGYLVRVGANHPAFVNSSIPGVCWEGAFTGVPNNGPVSFTISDVGQRYNLTGNPYPSAIDIVKFMNDNSNVIDGTVWIWRKKNDTTTPQHYVTINSAGVYVGNQEPGTETDPHGIVRGGQGFLVKVKENHVGNTLTFTNAMRLRNTANQFFRAAQSTLPGESAALPERHGVWLNLTSAGTFVSQLYVGYIAGATQAADTGIDSQYFNDRTTVLSSVIDTKEYVIQGRALPFNANDVVALMFKTAAAGTFTISLDRAEGLFTAGQDVYLKDNIAGVTHKLNDGDYIFTSEAGTFAARFEVVYANSTLSTDKPAAVTPDSIVVYKQGNEIFINGNSFSLAEVDVYDMRGRVLYSKKGINATETSVQNLEIQQQVIIVQVKTTGNEIIAKKILM